MSSPPISTRGLDTMTEGMSSWPLQTCLLLLYVTISFTQDTKLSTTSPTTLPTERESSNLDIMQEFRNVAEAKFVVCFLFFVVVGVVRDVEVVRGLFIVEWRAKI